MASHEKFFKYMDIECTSPEQLREYTKLVKRNPPLEKFEQLWADKFLSPLLRLMGHHDIWESFGVTIVNRSEMKKKVSYPKGYFSGNHWYSRRAHDTKTFDPYDKYQLNGTNSFCQTFALMYAVEEIDRTPASSSGGFTRYYTYARHALRFIKKVITDLPSDYSFTWIDRGLSSNNAAAKKQMLNKANECLKHVNACINLAGVLPRGLS